MGQLVILPTPPGTSLEGQTCLITGANSGIGFETARQMLTLKASPVIITARDKYKGQAAVAALRQDPEILAANPSARVEMFHLDLDDYQSGLALCDLVKREVSELDVLLCNGGMNIMHYQRSKSGHEQMMQVNCYTHFLIILELLPLLRATAAKRKSSSRVTFVGSVTQYHHTLSRTPLGPTENVLSYYDDKEIYQGLLRYSDSKFVVNAFIRRLGRVVSDSEVIVNNFCPGLVESTGLDRAIPRWLKLIMYIYRRTSSRPLKHAGWTAIHATAVAGRESHGKFIQSNKIDPGPPLLNESAGNEFVERLWKDFVADVASLDPMLKLFAHWKAAMSYHHCFPCNLRSIVLFNDLPLGTLLVACTGP
ncbi:putative short-chain dehydrogenase [Aspergillus ibericus CBS 121593]|uniref:Putative short-chain dehydrogenase n=1 Tax=Aspergillus ibericus CBS 121593 TaxID=1448316 RepID=A0A395GRE8_9EURO|nr:putative short-chain dehydrogenase [Aspergillus ibericus CBS 121593]RAK98131.1 putative short-chain dehydrogenase [Aspergillus ibericus CBS 121593]